MDISTEDLNAIFAKAKVLAKESRNGGSRSSRRAESTTDEARPLKRRRLGNVNEDTLTCELPLPRIYLHDYQPNLACFRIVLLPVSSCSRRVTQLLYQCRCHTLILTPFHFFITILNCQ